MTQLLSLVLISLDISVGIVIHPGSVGDAHINIQQFSTKIGISRLARTLKCIPGLSTSCFRILKRRPVGFPEIRDG